MKLTFFRYSTLAIFVFTIATSSMAIAGDGTTARLETVQVARSGEKVGARGNQDAASGSLSAKINLPLLDPNPTLPKVVLSEGHKKTCLKRTGDQLDAVKVKDVDGKVVELKEELSDQLTVMIFWSEESVPGYEQFRRIPVDVLAKFAPYRVKVVAINVGGTVAETKRLTGAASTKILSLADSDASLFKTFASEQIPRTYVLDKDGRIMWFDMEYSESTRRSLSNALTYFIKQTAANEK